MEHFPFFIAVVAHFLFTIFTAAGEAPTKCAQYSVGWACNSPFEPFIQLANSDFSILTVVLGGFALLETIVRIFLFDYAMLSQPGLIMGSFGWIVRIAFICCFVIGIGISAMSVIRR